MFKATRAKVEWPSVNGMTLKGMAMQVFGEWKKGEEDEAEMKDGVQDMQ